MHTNGQMHSDIKPDNVMVIQKAGKTTTKLIDFGVSCGLSEIDHHHAKGTLSYMAPEQLGVISKAISFKTDIWALGVTAYQMANLNRAFEKRDDETSENFQKRMHTILSNYQDNSLPYTANVSSELRGLINAMMTKDIDDRASAIECLQMPLFKLVS